MIKKVTMLLLVILSAFPVFAKHQPAKIRHVIYVTLDGVRWQDVFENKTNFPRLWHRYAAKLNVYGDPAGDKKIEVASIPVSLPSYQSQMTGAVQSCDSNQCGKVGVQTLPEYLRAKMDLKRQDVAVFSSWPVIADALESSHGNVYSNVGNIEVVDPITNLPDDFMIQVNELQARRHHVKSNRLDSYTFAQAMHYFETYKPRFLWISLVNADNEAHDNHPEKYHRLLSAYDHYLDEIFTTLKQMKLADNTMVIVTTDHGRGDGDKWVTHGPGQPESKATWAFVMNGKLTQVPHQSGEAAYSTLSIRPTIEAALIN